MCACLEAQAGVKVHGVFVIAFMVIVPGGVRAQFLLVLIEICESFLSFPYTHFFREYFLEYLMTVVHLKVVSFHLLGKYPTNSSCFSCPVKKMNRYICVWVFLDVFPASTAQPLSKWVAHMERGALSRKKVLSCSAPWVTFRVTLLFKFQSAFALLLWLLPNQEIKTPKGLCLWRLKELYI